MGTSNWTVCREWKTLKPSTRNRTYQSNPASQPFLVQFIYLQILLFHYYYYYYSFNKAPMWKRGQKDFPSQRQLTSSRKSCLPDTADRDGECKTYSGSNQTKPQSWDAGRDTKFHQQSRSYLNLISAEKGGNLLSPTECLWVCQPCSQQAPCPGGGGQHRTDLWLLRVFILLVFHIFVLLDFCML